MIPSVEVRHLRKYFPSSKGLLHAVDDVSMTIEKGKTLGVVGESGCGKSTFGKTIIHLCEATSGEILFEGKDITNPTKKELRALRENMQIIFQDPYSSLDPRMMVEELILEPLKISHRFTKQEMYEEATKLMAMVGIDERLRRSYPHELNGGRRQRVVIARALALQPRFIVCDEPVSALDVSVQAQILNLLKDLQKKYGLTYMFVTHDMSVVRHISEEICVMYLGQVVEKAPTEELFKHPTHPYTRALLASVPSVDIHSKRKAEIIQGEIASPINPKPGCRFYSRCKYANESCKSAQPLRELSPGHFVACCTIEGQDAEL